MTTNAQLNADQQDALQELLNISMGQAANALAQLMETQINISIPKIDAVTPAQLYDVITGEDKARYTRQSFLGDIQGEVMAIVSQQGLEGVGQLLEYDSPLSKNDIDEIILELSNILAGACLSGLSQQLELVTTLHMPTLFSPKKAGFQDVSWYNSLIMEVKFDIQVSSFSMRVVFCLDEQSLRTLVTTIDDLLA